jgi:hypothetical protein
MAWNLFGNLKNWKKFKNNIPIQNGPLKNQQPQLWKFITKSYLIN